LPSVPCFASSVEGGPLQPPTAGVIPVPFKSAAEEAIDGSPAEKPHIAIPENCRFDVPPSPSPRGLYPHSRSASFPMVEALLLIWLA